MVAARTLVGIAAVDYSLAVDRNRTVLAADPAAAEHSTAGSRRSLAAAGHMAVGRIAGGYRPADRNTPAGCSHRQECH